MIRASLSVPLDMQQSKTGILLARGRWAVSDGDGGMEHGGLIRTTHYLLLTTYYLLLDGGIELGGLIRFPPSYESSPMK